MCSSLVGPSLRPPTRVAFSSPIDIHARHLLPSHDLVSRTKSTVRLQTVKQAVGRGLAITRSLAPSFGTGRTRGVRHPSVRELVPPGRAFVAASAIKFESDRYTTRPSSYRRLFSCQRLPLGTDIINRTSQEKGKKHSKWQPGRKRRRLPRMLRSTRPSMALQCLAAVRPFHVSLNAQFPSYERADMTFRACTTSPEPEPGDHE